MSKITAGGVECKITKTPAQETAVTINLTSVGRHAIGPFQIEVWDKEQPYIVTVSRAEVDHSSSIVRKDDARSDITVNISEVARMHKQGGEPWSYLSIYELNEKDVRIECAVLINGDLAGALKIARAALGEKK